MSIHDTEVCPKCGADLRGDEIPESARELYGGRTHFTRVINVEYPPNCPYHYDGVSEYKCPDCSYREGRWTQKELKPNEHERVHGGFML